MELTTSTPSIKWKLAKRKNIKTNIKVQIMGILITVVMLNISLSLKLVKKKK